MISPPLSTPTSPRFAPVLSSIRDLFRSELSDYMMADWDGDGAEAVSEAIIEKAASAYNSVPLDLAYPSLTGGYDGSIFMSWIESGMSCFVHVPPEGPIDLAFTMPGPTNLNFEARLDDDRFTLSEYLKPISGFLPSRTIEITVFFITTIPTYPVTPHVADLDSRWQTIARLALRESPGSKE